MSDRRFTRTGILPEPHQVSTELERIAEQFISDVQQQTGNLPTAVHDPEWPSACIQETRGDECVFWKPVRRDNLIKLAGLETALECTFPVQLHEFFSYFWSGSIPVSWGDRYFELLQMWNSQDEENLLHNFLGHALEKKRVREKLTLFFAVVDDKRFLSCDVASGAIMLEEVGGQKPEVIADSMLALLSDLTGVATQTNGG